MINISPEELRNQSARIIASGVLGRSKTYAAILEYLVECAISGDQPKELAIAVDVLGRDADFDVGKDSIVRVHLYHLRSKLNSYYEKQGRQDDWRLEIPKGQYLLVAVANTEDEAAPQVQNTPVHTGFGVRQGVWHVRLTLALAALLALSLLSQLRNREVAPVLEDARGMAPWSKMLDDEMPIVVVVGDYFIFGELDEQGRVARMVRDFDVNSAADLDALMMLQPELYEQYYNLGLSYLPVGSAAALASLMPVFYDQQHRVSVRTISELSANDLTGNHILYIGYLSGLGLLEDLMFAASDLQPGVTYDELVASDGNEYVTDSGILNRQDEFRDFGLVSAFTSPRGNQFVLVAGMRDAALISMAEKFGTAEGLSELFSAVDSEGAWQGLYEVYGYDHTGFDAHIVRTEQLDPELIWGGE